MATPISQLKATAAELAARVVGAGLLVWNETAKRWHGGDGVTMGGIAMARYDERNDGALGFEQRIETDAANTVTVADLGRVIIGNRETAIAFNLAAASSLTSKFVAGFKNIGAGAMTIVPNGVELIDGVNAAITLPTGASVLLKCDGSGFRSYFSNADVTGAAINNAVPLSGANLADGDKLGVFDASAASLAGMTITQFVDGIFKTARKIANAYFLSSFRLWDAADSTKGLGFVLTGVATATTRLWTVPDRDIDFNNALLRSYESAPQTITSAGTLTIAHGLGVKPKLLAGQLVCQAGEFGFTAGDELDMPLTVHGATAGVTVRYDTTNLYIQYGGSSGVFSAGRLNAPIGTVVSLSNANWRLIVKAWA